MRRLRERVGVRDVSARSEARHLSEKTIDRLRSSEYVSNLVWRKFLMKRFVASIAVITMALFGGGQSKAGPQPAFTITTTSTTDSLANPPFTLGFEFSATQAITVTQLGVFDNNQVGLVDSHLVGLFAMDGTLIASATVASGTTEPLVNQFRYQSIAPVTLTAGTYFLGALYLTGDDGLLFPGDSTGFATAPAITFIESTYAGGSTLSPPTSPFNDEPGYFGPNLIFTTAVPEPSSLLMLGVGIACVGLRLRRTDRSA
jgi:hypothetical protein